MSTGELFCISYRRGPDCSVVSAPAGHASISMHRRNLSRGLPFPGVCFCARLSLGAVALS